MEDIEYRKQEELYQRIVDKYGRDRHGNQHFEMNDTGVSFELTNTILRDREHIYVGIELPVTIEKGATSQVNMVACLSHFSDFQRSRLNDENEDAQYWDGLESMIGTLNRFKRFRNILYAPKKGPRDILCAQERNADLIYRRSGYDGENVQLVWTPDGPEYIYTIPTETERDLILLVTDFRLDDNCIFNVHDSVRDKWQLSDLYYEKR